MTHFFRGGRGNSGFFNPNRWERRTKAGRCRNLLGLELRYSVIEPLEERVMLDIGGASSVPPTIVVGRTLSAYDVPDVRNNQETLTFTVYNESGDDIAGVLLTDTLANGVTFASASQLPDQNGQELAWSLGTIKAFNDASVTLTVSLAKATPTTLDLGASAYGSLGAGMVNWTTSPATLRTTAIPANLLASTPDANTNDPYVQEKAAELNYDPTQIYNFLQTQVGYNSYSGSLRGARGTLWSGAGNSLDDASLGVALMRASGIPAQYEEGTLSTAQAQQLILSMFPTSYQTVGYVPAGTQTSDPANDPQLLSEAKDHFWFQFDAGSGMKDADPEFAGQAVGQNATASSNTFSEVPDNLRQKTEVSLTVEEYSTGAAAFGLNPFSDTTVLDQTFNDVDLVGRSVVLGHTVSQTSAGALALGSITTSYSPYLAVLDEGSTANQAEIIKGTEYQDVLTSFPFSTQAVTGIFLNMQLTGPGLSSQSYQYTIADRIGYVARQSGGPVHLNASPSTAQPLLTNFDVFNIDASGSAPNPSNLSPMVAEINAISSAPVPTGVVPSDGTAILDLAAEEAHVISSTFYDQSDDSAQLLSDSMLVKAYEDRPRIMVVAHRVTQSADGSVSVDASIDLTRNSLRVIPIPGQNLSQIESFNVTRGLLDTYLEEGVLSAAVPGSTASGAGAVLSAATAQNIPLVVLDASTASAVTSLAISAEGKARIASAIADGDLVVVPTREVALNGEETIAWLEVNPTTGETIGVSENGLHNGFVELGAVTLTVGTLVTIGYIVASLNAYTYFKNDGQLIGDLYVACHQAAIASKSAKAQRQCQEAFKHAKDKAKAFAEEVDHILKFVNKDLQDPAETGLKDGIHNALSHANLAGPKDPPLPTALVGDIAGGTGELDSPTTNAAQLPLTVAANLSAGPLTGQGDSSAVSASGALTASWSNSASGSVFHTSSLSATSATVFDSTGAAVGAGSVTLSGASLVTATISGNDQYQMTGAGAISFYGPAENSLGVGGTWTEYTATVTGNVRVEVNTGSLTLNGITLPAGQYGISATSLSMAGSGDVASPTYAASASVSVANGTIDLGNGTGKLNVGSSHVDLTNGVALVGYTGTLAIAPGAPAGLDSVTLNGSASNVMSVAAAPNTLTADQNTPVSFQPSISTSFSDSYSLSVSAPAGWNVAIGATGLVTLTPAAGVQSGTYPVQIFVQSATNPDLEAQSTVNVAVTSTAPGANFSVRPDTYYGVPFNGADVPSAFQALIRNTGPAADTYKLTFANVPGGFTILSTATSVTVPAGQTGILGLYLQPTGTTLPPPGTDLSFMVTATSTTNPAIMQTVNVSFTMPAVDAVTVASNPASVTSTPGSPATATVTITNVGNVPTKAALSSSTDSNLTASGLPTAPVSVGVGQSTTETVTLTPAASAALNSTLTATFNAGPAATSDTVSVVSVSAALAGAGGTATPQAGTGATGAANFAPGETVDVTTDILAGVTSPRKALASYTVTDSTGTTVFMSTPVTVALGALPADDAVDLGTMATAALAAGFYTVHVSITEIGGQAIAGATGTGTLLINSPVAAGLSVDAEQASPGVNIVTSTLTVANQPSLGSVLTDGTASSVAVNGTLAYVAGTKDINVVDISDPSNPKIVGTFGGDKLISGGDSFVQVSGNDLVVATRQIAGATSFDVLVYTLSDPKNPQFAGSVSVPYGSLASMSLQGTTAYFPTAAYNYDPSSGSVSGQFGDLAAVDFSNPTSPKFDGVLFNDLGAPNGHAGFESQFAPAGGQLAYLVGSTSSGADTQTGVGRVLIVNTNNPANLSVSGELDLPGTVVATAIAVDGNTALVVGSSGGLLSPFGDLSNSQLTGNLTLTLLNVSNPASPTIIGSTVVTQETFASYGENSLGGFQAVSLGNNRFAVTDALLNGAFVMLTVDASTPSNPAIDAFTVSSPISGLAALGGELLAASANGLQVLQANALTTTSVTAEVDVPNTGATINLNSFSTPPTQIVPGANSTALIWKLSLAPGDNQQITWQSTTSDLLPGEIQQVATGASVQFTESGTSESITLPALNVVAIEAPQSVQIPLLVRSAQTVAISQAAVDAGSAGSSQLAATLSELSDSISQLQTTPSDPNLLSRTRLLLNNLSPELAADPALAPFVAQLAPLQADANSGDVTDLLAALPTFFQNVDAVLAVEASEQFTISVSPNEVDLPALANQQKNLTVTVADTGPKPVTLTLSTGALPNGVTANLGPTQITLQPGASQTVPLTLNSNLVSTHIFTLDVKATDSTDSALATVSHDGTAVVAVRAAAADVLGVTVNPISVTNAGTPIAVSASIFNTANASRSVLAHLTVLDSTNKVVASPPDVPISLAPAASAVNFDLGNLDTTGLANGVYTLEVSLRAADGTALPGKSSEAPFLVGVPISASVSGNPSTLPPGTSTVTTTITVSNTDPPTGNTTPNTNNTNNNNTGTNNTNTTSGNNTPTQNTPTNVQPQSADPPAAPPAPPTPPAFNPPAGDAVKWIGPASGNWDLAANWLDTTTNTKHVPDATDNVTIDAPGLTITVETGNQAAQSLLVKTGSTLAVTGGDLSVSSGAEIDGTVNLSGGHTLAMGGGATIAGSLSWANGGVLNLDGGKLFNTGTMNLSSTVYLDSRSPTGTSNLKGTLYNEGTVVEQSGSLYLYDSVTLDNTSGGTWQFADDVGIGNGSFSPIVVNDGTFEKTSGTGTSSIALPLTSTGGTFQADSGTLALGVGGDSFDGTSFNAQSGATINLGNGESFNAATFNAEGSGATINTGSGATFDAGTFTAAAGGAINLSGNNTFSGTLSGSGAGTVSLSSGDSTIGAGGATFDFPAGMFQWTNAGIDLLGNTLTNSGSLTLGSDTSNTNESLYSANTTQNNLGGTLENLGTITLAGTTALYLYDGVTIDNPSGSSVLFAGDGSIDWAGRNQPVMNNGGLLEKTSGTGTSGIPAGFASTGQIKVDSGTLSLATNGSATIAGTNFVVASGATLDLAGNSSGNVFSGGFTGSGGGTVLLEGGGIVIGSGGATFDFPAGMFQWTGGGINLEGNTLTNTGAITVANKNIVSLYANDFFSGGNKPDLGGTLDNQGTIADEGPSAVNLYDSVLLKNEAAATVSLTGGASLVFGNYSSAISNAGTINAANGGGTTTISAPLTNSGTLTDVAGELDMGDLINGGTVDAGANPLKFSNADVQNSGTLETEGGTLSFDSNSTFNNTGTLQVNGGSADFAGRVTQLEQPNPSSSGYLTGGTWIAAGGGAIRFPTNYNVSYNYATIVIKGAGSSITGIQNLAANNGALAITSGATFTTAGDFTNNGVLTLGGGSTAGTLRPAETTALAFNGSSDYVQVGNTGARPTQGALSFWMQPTTVSSYQDVLTTGPTNSNGSGGNQAIRFEENGQSLYALFGSDTANDSSGFSSFLLTNSLTPGAWVNVALTWDSSTNQVTGYLNGNQVFSGTNANFPSEFGNVTFGVGYSLNPGYERYYNGLLNDVRLYDVQRSQADIQSDMTSLLTGGESGLIGYWPLNDGSGTTAKDLSAGAHNGTLGGGTAANEPTWAVTDVALGVPGNFTQSATGTLDVQLGGTPASGHFGQIAATGTATFAGMLRSEFTNGYTPTAGDNFTVATYASTTGSFGAIDLAETPTVAYSANVGTSSLVLQSQAATLTPTQTTVSSSAPSGANYGQLVEYTATVTASSGTPTGSVQFQVDGLNQGLPIALSGGQATVTLALPAGTHSITAFYISGSSQFSNSDDAATPLTQIVNPAAVTPSSIELYYTTYGGPASVDKVAVSLSQGNVTLGTPATIVQNIPADGLIFLPNGDLLTADGEASEINPNTGAVTTETQVSGAHLALDPSGKYVWTSPQPGSLYKLPIDPLGPATVETLTGDDTQVTHLAFDNSGQAFYVSSGPGGYGSFGLIDLTTFTTRRIYSDLPAAHGITYDPFTGDLFLVGAASVAQIDPNTLKIVSELDFPGSGFEFDQGAEDGKGHLYAADNGGHLLVVDYSGTGLIGDPRNFVATPFLATDLDDVAPLSGLGGAGIPVTVTHQLPATGYDVNPTSITPNPSSFSSSDVTWNTTFTPGQPETDQFQLAGQVTNMAPGEVRQISEGTTVTATVTATDGTQIPVSINLPPVVVAAQHIIELTPPTETVDQGATATYTVELSNPLPTDETYTLSIDGLPAGENATLAVSVPVAAGKTVDVPLTISVPLGALQGMQAFLVSAQTLEGASDSVEGQLTVSANVATSALAVNLSLTPTHAVAGQTNPAIYTLTVTNTGDTTDTYNLAAALPQGFTGTFSQTTITVPPGISNFRDIQFSVTPPAGATAQDYPFTITATSATDGTVSAQAGGTVSVLAQGVQVQLTPSSAVPGSTYQLKVTNTGQTADTFNLSLASAGALVATLGTNQVTLQPGASQTVPVTTTAANFADAGAMPLTGIATSQTNSSVQAQSTADLSIASTQSMTAAFNPAQQTLVVPGQTSFLLQVNNTGNTEDSYSATIVGTTGPITANLVGLDGQPTQSVPLFILPGLASGAILLQVNATGTGQGTVTVLVQSLSNSSIQAAPTATITVPAPVVPPPTLTLTNDTGAAATEGASTVLTNAMLQATDSDTSVTAANIVYKLTATPAQGALLLGGQTLAAGSTFTQDDVNSGRVAYKASEEGGDSFGFSVSATGAASLTGTFLIATSDPAVVPTGGFTFNAVEGASSSVQTVATFTDPGGFEPRASYSAEINWGDGTSSAGTIILPAAGQAAATVTGQHTYAEEGNYTLSIAIGHEGAPIATAAGVASVSDPAVVASGGFTFSAIAGDAGTAQTVAVFTDPGGAEAVTDYSATIDWGDGSNATIGVISLGAATGLFAVAGQHVYASPGDYPIHVTVSHDSAPSASVTSAAAVSVVGTAPILTLAKDAGAPATEGASVGITNTLLQTTDSDSSVLATNIVYTLTAAPTQGSLLLSGQPLTNGGTFTQDDIDQGRLTYMATEEGADAFGFNVAASGAARIGGTFLIATSDPAVVATGGFTFTASEGSSSAPQTVATFTDPGGFEPQASYSAEIDWGDGTSSAGAVVLPGAGQVVATVTGQHTYAEEGDYSVHITLHHEGAPATTATSKAVVSDPAVAATGGFIYSATEGNAGSVQTVAVFTDPGGAEAVGDYSATIDWGDGTSAAAGGVTFDAATHIFTVSGQHDYSQDGTYSVKVTLAHESAPAITVTSAAQIANASTSGGGGIAATGLTLTGNELTVLTSVAVATFTDGDGSLPAADFSATIDWGDGTSSAGSIALSSGTYTVSGSHEYTDEGHYTVKVSVDQTAGPTTGGTTSATVSAAATIHEQPLVNGAVGTPNQKWVQEVYRDLFGRQAELQGLNYWVAELTQGVPRAEVAHEMVQVASFQEFQHDTVVALYRQYLGRAPDAAGEAYWTAYLYNGGTIPDMSLALVTSPEFYDARGGGTVDGFLNALFQDALGRSIDASALAYFQRQMAQGATAADVAAAVFASDEYHRVRVNALFEQLLDRAADAGALDYYAGELDSGAVEELVVTQLISSDEYFNRLQV
ncbi:MAG TPA: DUF4214 domain-containing protein [Pirellulales bacterium]|nr:DUF4214 domain-containing protein [Pirellulales bacterium]